MRAGDYEAVVASVGATLRVLTHAGRNLIVPFDADEVRPAYRGATLVPWPNRVIDGAYSFEGSDFVLPLTEPDRGHALHGLGAWLDYHATDVGASHVTLRAIIPPQAGYPWRVAVTTTFILSDYGLAQSVTARNLSSTPAPWGTGPHPYLVAGGGRVDDWTLELPASRVLTVTEDRLAPVAVAEVDHDADRFDFRVPRPVRGVQIDHAFTGLARGREGSATVRVTDEAGSGVEMSWDAACPWVQVYTADGPDPATSRRGLAVEPMTCSPDAFNDARYDFDTGLQSVAPGGTTAASWRIAAIS
ncbi:aldose 1-epimerase family protein [Microbacterium koreense]|uniref:Aldose 1-epimerase family protein n=1 Tax=Microbacterium koreense TaxID=323761 RepID=A0ABW2ZPI9_9MICO